MRRFAAAIALVLGLASIGFATAYSAQAASASRSSVAKADSAQCSEGKYCIYVNLNGGSPFEIDTCIYPHTETHPSTPIYILQNLCNSRVWIHQNANGTGWSECFTPQSGNGTVNSAYRYPGNIQVTTNYSSC